MMLVFMGENCKDNLKGYLLCQLFPGEVLHANTALGMALCGLRILSNTS